MALRLDNVGIVVEDLERTGSATSAGLRAFSSGSPKNSTEPEFTLPALFSGSTRLSGEDGSEGWRGRGVPVEASGVEQDSEPVALEPLEAVRQRFTRLRVPSLIELIDGLDYEIGCYLGEAATRCQNDPVMYVHRTRHQCGTPKGDPRSLDRQLTMVGSVLGRLPAHPAYVVLGMV